MKKLSIVFCVVVLLLMGGEIVLRLGLGMCNAPLYQESYKCEYMACPNQDGKRFGRHYHFNSYQQRSEEPDTTKNIVLGLGDLVLFGGVITDQKSTSPYIFNSMRPDCQMLNISVGSLGT